MKIALASPPFPRSIKHGLEILHAYTVDASGQGAQIICFPESFLPGYPGMGYPAEDRSPAALQEALQKAADIAKRYHIALVLPMDGYIDDKLYNLAYVIGKSGEILGYQTKNQLAPSEDQLWTAGEQRQLFEIEGLKFGIAICHEGFRYPESLRWAAFRGAQVVFHPHFSGSNQDGPTLTTFAARENPFYERAMMMRALENTIYFASVNYASDYQESTSALIDPDGELIAHQPYTVAGNLVIDIDPNRATGKLAKRFKPQLFL